MAAALVAVGWMAGGSPQLDLAAESSLVLGIALLIPWLTRPRTAAEGGTVRRVAWFGVVVSYPFYLWHVAVMDAVVRNGLVGPLAFGVTFALATLVSVASYRAVELPAMRWARSPGRYARRLGHTALPATQPGTGSP